MFWHERRRLLYANSAHPYENPNAHFQFSADRADLHDSLRLTYTLGRMTGSQRHGWAVWAARRFCFWRRDRAYWAEARGTRSLQVSTKRRARSSRRKHGSKEVRFGIANSRAFATVTTDASCGAVNSMHDSFTPLEEWFAAEHHAGRSHFWRRWVGLYGMWCLFILAVFIAGLR